MTEQKKNKKILGTDYSDIDLIFNILKTYKKTGEGFAECIGSFWDDKSIRDLAELIASKVRREI